MPNYEAIKERILAKHWRDEGETSDGTNLVSCPLCGCIVSEHLMPFHARYHADKKEE